MGKSTEPPTCRFCGKAHRGTCMDHEAKGAISSQLGYPATPGLKKSAARVIKAIESSGGSSAVERRPSKPTVEGSTPSPRSKKSAASPKAKDRPLRGKALSRDSAIALSPSGPADRKRVSTTITDKVNGISHTSVHVPIPAAELANLYAGAIPKKRKPRMTQPIDKPAKPTRGRPKTVADRKAYKAEKEKERRARQKLAK